MHQNWLICHVPVVGSHHRPVFWSWIASSTFAMSALSAAVPVNVTGESMNAPSAGAVTLRVGRENSYAGFGVAGLNTSIRSFVASATKSSPAASTERPGRVPELIGVRAVAAPLAREDRGCGLRNGRGDRESLDAESASSLV